MRNFAEFTKIISVSESIFLIKSQTLQISIFIKNESLEQVLSCEICDICGDNFFAENHRTTASDYSSTIVVKGELANETVNCDTKTKAYTNLSWKFKLLKTTVQVKEQVVHRLQIGCSQKVRKFHKTTSALESLFNKVAGIGLQHRPFPKKGLQHKCFPVKFANFLRTTFLQNSFSGYFCRLGQSDFFSQWTGGGEEMISEISANIKKHTKYQPT